MRNPDTVWQPRSSSSMGAVRRSGCPGRPNRTRGSKGGWSFERLAPRPGSAVRNAGSCPSLIATHPLEQFLQNSPTKE